MASAGTPPHKAFIAHSTGWLPAREPTQVLGIDETCARSVPELREEAGWRRTDPWMTPFVNAADPDRRGRLLGLVPRRSGGCRKAWSSLQDRGFRDGIQIAVIGPSAPQTAGIRSALPNAAIAVDKWHLVKLGNDLVTDVRPALPAAAEPAETRPRRG